MISEAKEYEKQDLERFWYLIDTVVAAGITPAELQELEALLLDDDGLREKYLKYLKLHYQLKIELLSQKSVDRFTKTLQESDANDPPSQLAFDGPHVAYTSRGFEQPLNEPVKPSVFFQPYVLAGLIAVTAASILVGFLYLSSLTGEMVRVEEPTAGNKPQVSVAKIASVKGAVWESDFKPSSDALFPGQRLKLVSGLAEIGFNSQAKIVLEGPAELVVAPPSEAGTPELDLEIHKSKSAHSENNSCYLASGALTAVVPSPAHGFAVYTPSGIVTDLGTAFGVVVEPAEKAQKPEAGSFKATSAGRNLASTEVHVFRGQVSVTEESPDRFSEPAHPTSPQPSKIHPQSQNLSAGQSICMTSAGLGSISFADPFRFQTNVLGTEPRRVLLAEDFEAFPAFASGQKLDEWITAYQSGLGRGILIVPLNTYGAKLANSSSVETVKDPNTTDALSPFGRRAVEFRNLNRIAKHLYPLFGRDIVIGSLPTRCKLLMECDILPGSSTIEPSLNFLAKVRLAPAISLGDASDTDTPRVEWRTEQWYRIRTIFDITDGRVSEVRLERLKWKADEGWRMDIPMQAIALSPTIPLPRVQKDVRVEFGFPAPILGSANQNFLLDNVRIELLSDDNESA